MKHAGAGALRALDPVLKAVRALPGLRERKPGTFYRKSAAFLHFHEDPDGLFADLKVGSSWKRFGLAKLADRRAFLRSASRAVREPSS